MGLNDIIHVMGIDVKELYRIWDTYGPLKIMKIEV